jgi:hypothetical protein
MLQEEMKRLITNLSFRGFTGVRASSLPGSRSKARPRLFQEFDFFGG